MKELFCASFLAASAGFASSLFAVDALSRSVIPATSRADARVTWSDLIGAISAAADRSQTPVVEARTNAMIYLAMESAILAVHNRAQPVGSGDFIEQAAAGTAAREVLLRAWPTAAARMDAVVAQQLAAAGTLRDQARALDEGRRAAAHVLRQREGDGWCDAAPLSALRIRTSTTEADGFKSPWLTATPFALKNAGQFSPRLPYWRNVDGEAFPDFLITRTRLFEKVDRATPATVLTQFWSGSPLAAWNRVAHTVIARSGLDIVARARVLALVNVAMADATLAALHAQAEHGRMQPHWGERWTPVDGPAMPTDLEVDVHGAGNLTTFRQDTRPVLSAPLRNYPALSATVASAACAALAVIPNGDKIAFELAASGGGAGDARMVRTFSTVADAARECTFAASLDGQSSREACVAGYHLGEDIGRHVLKRMRAPR